MSTRTLFLAAVVAMALHGCMSAGDVQVKAVGVCTGSPCRVNVWVDPVTNKVRADPDEIQMPTGKHDLKIFWYLKSHSFQFHDDSITFDDKEQSQFFNNFKANQNVYHWADKNTDSRHYTYKITVYDAWGTAYDKDPIIFNDN